MTATVTAPETPEPAAAANEVGRGWALALGVVIVLAVAAAGFSVVGRDYVPVGDDATIEMLVRDVGAHTPLVGFNSRFTWNHPGPWTFWLLAGPYRLFGDAPASMLVSAGVINAAMIAGFVWLAYRRGRLALLAWAGLLLVVLCRSIGFEYLRNPWNPWMGTLAFALFVFAVWCVVEGDLAVLPVAVLSGSFAYSNHVGYLALVGGLGAWGLLFVVARSVAVRRRGDRTAWLAHRRRLLVWGGVSVGVFLLFWAPVLYEQVIHDPGNIRRTYDYFRTDETPRATVGQALDIFGMELGLRAPWLGWRESVAYSNEIRPTGAWTAIVTLGMFVGTGVFAWRRRAWDALRLHGTVALTVALALASLVSLRGTRYPYLFRWTWVVGMFVVLASGWAVYRGCSDAARARLGRVAVPVLGVAAAVLALVMLGTQWNDPMPNQVFEEQTRTLVEPTVAAYEGEGPVLVEPLGFGFNVPYNQLIVALEKAGADVRTPNRFWIAYGRHRALKEGETVHQVVSLVEGDTDITRIEADPRYRKVAEFVPTAREKREDRLSHIAVFLSDQDVTGGPPPAPMG